MLPAFNSNIDRTTYFIKPNKNKRFTNDASAFLMQQATTNCMICIRSLQDASIQMLNKFCGNCLNKVICTSCVQQITSSPCPFCHTNNKIWRKSKRDTLFVGVERKIEDKKRFWEGLKIKQKNIHMQHAIKAGIQQYIHVLDGLVQKLTEDIKYLIKIDFEKDSSQIQGQVMKQIQEINMMEETYDKMMIDLKNQFNLEINSE